MGEAKLEPDVISYCAGISACGRGGQWQRALVVLSEMWEVKQEPNVMSYYAGISARGNGEQWQRALALLSERWEAKLESSVISPTIQPPGLAGRASGRIEPASSGPLQVGPRSPGPLWAALGAAPVAVGPAPMAQQTA